MAAVIVARHYARAPIIEALIDIQVRAPEGVALSTLAQVCRAERERYPSRQDRLFFHGELHVGERVGATASQRPVGYIAFTEDRLQAFQARLDGFTFSRFAPYDRWETFRTEAERLWAAYRDLVGPEEVTRIGVRYINRLELPEGVQDLKEYLRTIPIISSELPQQMTGFLMQVQIPQTDIDCVLELTEALVPPEQSGAVSVLLDIDIYRETAGPIHEDEIWGLLENLRERKNVVFAACITERTQEMIG
jgi:uncharacterized protein (TIGR04255 family)